MSRGAVYSKEGLRCRKTDCRTKAMSAGSGNTQTAASVDHPSPQSQGNFQAVRHCQSLMYCEATEAAEVRSLNPHVAQSRRNFHFACPATEEYTPECPARHLFRIRSNGEDLVVPAGPLHRPKSQRLWQNGRVRRCSWLTFHRRIGVANQVLR